MRPDALRALPLFLAVILAALRPCRASSVQFAHGESPRPEQWELLSVEMDAPPAGATLTLQDARGGLSVSRPIDSGSVIDPAGEKTRMLVPLPFLAAADLPVGVWSVEVTIVSPGGLATHERVAVRRASPSSATPGESTSLRVIVARGGAAAEARALRWQDLSHAPPVFVEMPDSEILSGPPLLFASCDALLLPDRLASRLTPDRISAILSAGMKIVSTTDPAKASNPGILEKLTWTRLGIAGAPDALWATPAPAIGEPPRPQAIESGLNRVRGLQVVARPTRQVRFWVMIVPALAVIVLLLARGLFRTMPMTLLATGLALCGVTGGVCLALRASAPPVSGRAQWVTTQALWRDQDPDAGPGAALWLKESFTATSSLFGEQPHASVDQDDFLYPVAPSVRDYFSMEHATLLLDAPLENGLRRGSQLDVVLGPRAAVAFAVRSPALLTAPTGDSERMPGEWLENGYIHAGLPTSRPADLNDSTAAHGMLVTQWAAVHPDLADSLLAWYELRFAAGHRYVLIMPAAQEPLRLIDLGPTKKNEQ